MGRNPGPPDDPNEMEDGRYNINTGEFSDIWDTDDKDTDKSRIWGTDEYFRRIELSRDEWDTGLEDYPGMTHRIKRETEIRKNAERIKEDARRISNNAKRFSDRIKIDAEKIRADARDAAQRVRNKVDQESAAARLEAQKELLRDYNFTPTPRIKKTKRRFKLSSKSGGIGIFGILFWGFLMFNMCSDDDSDTTAKVVDTSTDTNYTEQIKESIDKLKPEAEKLINQAKDELKKVTSEKKVAKTKTEGNTSDPYSQPDDRYGGTEDKW